MRCDVIKVEMQPCESHAEAGAGAGAGAPEASFAIWRGNGKLLDWR